MGVPRSPVVRELRARPPRKAGQPRSPHAQGPRQLPGPCVHRIPVQQGCDHPQLSEEMFREVQALAQSHTAGEG